MKQKLLMCTLILLCVCFGFSRETGTFGFLFKANDSNNVGLTINLSNRVTLRPTFGFITRKLKQDVESDTVVKDNSYNVNLGLFYHFLKKGHFTAYSGFEGGYTYRKRQSESRYYSGDLIIGNKTRGYSGNVIFGLQYNFNKRLAVFGEVAYGFRTEKDEDFEIPNYSSIPSDISKSTLWSLSRSGFGIILYL